MGWFKWAGHDSRDFGMQVEHIPGIPTPARTLNSFDVPGHNGTLHYDTGGFENVTVEYECWFRAYDRRRIVPELGRKINGWLLGSGFGYQPLQDSYSPGFVRMAVPASGAGETSGAGAGAGSGVGSGVAGMEASSGAAGAASGTAGRCPPGRGRRTRLGGGGSLPASMSAAICSNWAARARRRAARWAGVSG